MALILAAAAFVLLFGRGQMATISTTIKALSITGLAIWALVLASVGLGMFCAGLVMLGPMWETRMPEDQGRDVSQALPRTWDLVDRRR